jgi:hypothetical protein
MRCYWRSFIAPAAFFVTISNEHCRSVFYQVRKKPVLRVTIRFAPLGERPGRLSTASSA